MKLQKITNPKLLKTKKTAINRLNFYKYFQI